MVHFQNKNPNLDKYWINLPLKMLVYIKTSWSILRPFGIFLGHLVYFMVIWYTFSRFGTLYQEKSGNPTATATLSTGAMSISWKLH
jgi:hypothetical protein